MIENGDLLNTTQIIEVSLRSSTTKPPRPPQYL